MFRITVAIALGLVTAASGCAPSLPPYKQDADVVLEAVRSDGAEHFLAAEYESARKTLRFGEELLQRGETAEANSYLQLAYIKALILEKNLSLEKKRSAEEEISRSRVQVDRDRRNLASEEQRGKRQNVSDNLARVERNRHQKDRLLPSFHAVKRGETLPQIAAQAEVFNDFRLWPLLYRSNRDQVSNPRHIQPGQTLRIPRNQTSEEIAEARRYAAEKPF